MSHIFISHAQQQIEEAKSLRTQLEKIGVTAWIASESIPPGTRWPTAILEAVRTAGAVVVLVTRRSIDSPMVKTEVGLAAHYRKPILPARVEDSQLHGDLEFYLSALQWYEVSGGFSTRTARELARKAKELLSVDSVDDASAADHIVDRTIAEREPPSETPAALAFRVTRDRPALFTFLLDCSNSMNRVVRGSVHRRHIVASTVNNILATLVDRSAREDGSFHRYFDVGVYGYGVGDGRSVSGMLDDGLLSIGTVAEQVRRWETVEFEQKLPDGSVAVGHRERPIWIEPMANRRGHTVTDTAFRTLLPVVEEWVDRHSDSIPPIVLHITDGGWPPEEAPHDAIRSIQEIATSLGSVLVFNCHVSFGSERPLVFPQPAAAERLADARMRDLLDLSSPLPPNMITLASESGYAVEPGARGYVLNADAAILSDFVDIGTLGNLKGM